MQKYLYRMNLPEYVMDILENSKGVIVPKTRTALFELTMGNDTNTVFLGMKMFITKVLSL